MSKLRKETETKSYIVYISKCSIAIFSGVQICRKNAHSFCGSVLDLCMPTTEEKGMNILK